MKNIFKEKIILVVLSFFILPIMANAAVGDGIFIYDQTTPSTNVQSRTWADSTNTVGAASSPFAGSGTSKHVYAKGSHTRSEILLGIQDSAGLLTIYKSIDNGLNWVSQWTATVGDGNLKRFEIAYEQTSGDALVVYSSNVATTNEIKYQTWNGTTWSGALNLDPIRTSGTVYGIRAAERNGSNEIGIVWSDTNLDLSANLWTGTAWYGERSTALETNLSKIGTSTVPTNRSYDIAFESLSGDLMVAWGTDATADAKYIFKIAGGAWGTTNLVATPMAEEPTMLDIAPSPISDKIAYVNCTDNGGDCDFTVWSGTAWGTNLNDASSGTPVVGDSGNNTEWLVDGTNEVAIFNYNDSAVAGIDWVTSVNGATPLAQTDNLLAPAVIAADRAGFARVNPSDSREGVFIFGNANSDLFVKRAYLTGTTVAWSNPTGLSTAIELNSSVVGFNPLAFAFVKYVPAIVLPTVTTQAVDNITDTTATGNGNITNTGGENNDLRGVVYHTVTHSNPGNVSPASSLYPNKVEESGSFGIGPFIENITGLTSSTTYYVRAYSHNSAGYFYGDEVSFVATASLKPISGALTSSVYDTTANTASVGYNSIMWKGTLGGVGQNEGKVRFQLAASNSSTGPWNYYGGSTCGSLDWFDPQGPNSPIELKGTSCLLSWNNKRYYKYKVQICSNDCVTGGLNSPTVNSIIVNWSP